MALIKCPECGKEISDKARECINCGYPIKEYAVDQEDSSNKVEHTETIKDSVAAANYSNTSYNRQTNWKAIIIVAAILAIIFYPSIKEKYTNSSPLDINEIIGKWGADEIYFDSDFTADVSGSDYLTGNWEIVSEDQKTIRLWYTATDEQVYRYTQDHLEEMEGYEATKEDVLEWELEYDPSVPPEGIYRFDRNEQRLYCDEYDYGMQKKQ